MAGNTGTNNLFVDGYHRLYNVIIAIKAFNDIARQYETVY